MNCSVKTERTVTFTCSECKIALCIEAESTTDAEKIARSLGWTEKQNGQAVCDECSC
jgi:hypothetical protein